MYATSALLEDLGDLNVQHAICWNVSAICTIASPRPLTTTTDIEDHIVHLRIQPLQDLGRQFGHKGGRILISLVSWWSTSGTDGLRSYCRPPPMTNCPSLGPPSSLHAKKFVIQKTSSLHKVLKRGNEAAGSGVDYLCVIAALLLRLPVEQADVGVIRLRAITPLRHAPHCTMVVECATVAVSRGALLDFYLVIMCLLGW